MTNRVKNILLILVVVFVTVFVIQISRLSEENKRYKKVLNDLREHSLKEKTLLANLDRIKEVIDVNDILPTEIIRKTMEFVYDNSRGLVNDEYPEYAFNIPAVVNKLLLAYKGNDGEKPFLTCGPRANAMSVILSRFGIASRNVFIYSDHYEQVKVHRLLEVLNPQTGSWEAWDPHHRVVYVDRDSKQPLDIITILLLNMAKVIPKDGAIMGWEETNTEHLKQYFFRAALIRKFSEGVDDTIIINRNRIDLRKKFSDGLTFKEWAISNYQQPRFMVLTHN